MDTPRSFQMRLGALVRMTGRQPDEKGRTASPLELLFDLAFVAAFGIAGNLLAHGVAAGHSPEAVGSFVAAIVGLVWAWMQFTWFVSAFGVDDWAFRVLTMVQMAGVVVYALGLPDLFHSIERGHPPDNVVMVAGYIVMRVAMLAQWARLAAQSAAYRATAVRYAVSIAAAQIGWIVLALAHLDLATTVVLASVLFLVEIAGPALTERLLGATPWHVHHLVERYGLLLIITLGEGIFGTVAVVQPLIEAQGWTPDVVVLVAAGVFATFGLWWSYFTIPFGRIISAHRSRAGVFTALHILIFGSVAAVGAGIHIAAYALEGGSHAETIHAVWVVSIAVVTYLTALLTLFIATYRHASLGLVLAYVAALVVVSGAIVFGNTGAAFSVELAMVAFAPWILVTALSGYRRNRHDLDDRSGEQQPHSAH